MAVCDLFSRPSAGRHRPRQGRHGDPDETDRACREPAAHPGLRKETLSYDARETLREKFPDAYVPCLRTIYNHIDAGDIGIARGETPYHPGRKRRPKHKAHPAKVLPNRNRIADRPPEAEHPTEPGHKELDTIVSCASGSGGLLTIVDKFDRFGVIEKLDAISREEVAKAIMRAFERDALKVGTLKTATTDNGTELSGQESLQRSLGCKVYYTRAYASYEKGAVENFNRIVRRWFPKGTDFSKVSEAEIRAVEDIVNSIHRKSLGGLSAKAFQMKAGKAA